MTSIPPEKPLGALGRLKAAGSVMVTGKLPNPLASEPENKSRAALVQDLNDWCVDERKFWKPVYDRIRQEQRFAAGKQWDCTLKDLSPEEEKYIGDMVQQLVNRKTAALYAKNPTPEAVVKDRMNFEVWDGQQDTIDNCKKLIATIAPQALQAHEAELSGQPMPPPPPQMQADLDQAQRILDDYARGMQEKAMLDKIAESGTKLIQQQWSQQSPDLLVCGKQAVTRVITSRVAFIKVMYKRDMESIPTESANDMEFSDKLATLTGQLEAIDNDETAPDDPKVEESRLLRASLEQQIAELQQSSQVPTDEGVVLDWLSATSVIVDRRCKLLKEFVGAHRIAHEIMMTVEECEKKFKVSLRNSGAKFYVESGEGWKSDDDQKSNLAYTDGTGAKVGKQKVCVWHIEDKDTGLCYVVCDGVKDFLKEPYTNEPKVNRFWSIVAVTFNAQEVETNDPNEDVTIYPRSDVRLMMPMQINVNWAGQEKRFQRNANRPGWMTFGDVWSGAQGEADLAKLSGPREAHDVFRMQSVTSERDVNKIFQALPKQPFDPNLYDNAQDSQAMMLATGQQPSDIGAQRPDEKATGQNIAAQARAESESSNIDDLNFAFSTVAQMCWEMLIQEMPQATVKKLVGRGAVWPELNREDVADSIFFKIEAGSMGRPNQQAELNKIQVLMEPIMNMLKMMNRSPEPFLKLVVKQWDANIDVDELLKEAQVLPPPAPTDTAQKPPSLALSMNFKDAPPEIQPQIEKAFGFQPAPPASHLINKVGHGTAISAAHENAGGGQPQKTQPATQ